MDTSRFHRPAPQTAVWFSSTDLAYANKPSRSAENRTPSTHVRGLCMQSHRSTLRREARGAYTLSGYREVEVKERGPSGCWLSCSSRPAVAWQRTWCAAGFGSSLVANPGTGRLAQWQEGERYFILAAIVGNIQGDCVPQRQLPSSFHRNTPRSRCFSAERFHFDVTCEHLRKGLAQPAPYRDTAVP